MRLFVSFLIILNALVFVWFTFQQRYQKAPDTDTTQVSVNFAKVQPLQLLQELPTDDVSARDKRKAVVKQQEQPEVVEAQFEDTLAIIPVEQTVECQIIGSYPEIISARQGRIDLSEYNINTRVVRIDKKLPAVSWIYIPSLPTRKDALLVLKKLQEKRIDSFLVSEEGEFKNAISLGFYGNEQSAKALLKERQAQGFNAKLTQKVRERKAYWLALEDQKQLQDEKIAQRISNFISHEKNLKKQEISCQELALLESIN